MRRFTRQVECLNCSNTRAFVHHGETSQRLIGQDAVGALSKIATLSCGRCGSFRLASCWTDSAPYSRMVSVGRASATAGPIEQ